MPHLVKVVAALVCLLAGCAATPPAPILDLQAAPDPIHRLAAALDAAGHYTHVLDATSLVLARSKTTETVVVIFLADDAAALQALLTCPWRSKPGDADLVTAWNATHPEAPAFLDDDHQPVLVADLPLQRTTTEAAVGAWGWQVLDLADAFVAEVWPAR